LLSDGDVLPRSISSTHKPNRDRRFAQAYAANVHGSYLVDNELLFAVAVSTYKLVRRMFFALLAMPMR
jgi:hypothetical protein